MMASEASNLGLCSEWFSQLDSASSQVEEAREAEAVPDVDSDVEIVEALEESDDDDVVILNGPENENAPNEEGPDPERREEEQQQQVLM